MIANFGLGGFEGEFAIFKSDPARKIFGRVGKSIIFWVSGSENVFGSGIFIDGDMIGGRPGGGFVDVGDIDSNICFGVKGWGTTISDFNLQGNRLMFFKI